MANIRTHFANVELGALGLRTHALTDEESEKTALDETPILDAMARSLWDEGEGGGPIRAMLEAVAQDLSVIGDSVSGGSFQSDEIWGSLDRCRSRVELIIRMHSTVREALFEKWPSVAQAHAAAKGPGLKKATPHKRSRKAA